MASGLPVRLAGVATRAECAGAGETGAILAASTAPSAHDPLRVTPENRSLPPVRLVRSAGSDQEQVNARFVFLRIG
jgi:hypothetical protein